MRTLRTLALCVLIASVASATAALLNRVDAASPTPTPTKRSRFEQVWELSGFPAKFYGMPEFSWRNVYVCADTTVLAIDRRSGNLTWNATVESPCQYIASFFDTVVVGSDNAITAFHEMDGKQKWKHDIATGSPGNPARPTRVADDRVAFTVENGQKSTQFTVLGLDTGRVLFRSSGLAVSRIWVYDEHALYVEVPSALNSSASIVSRNLVNYTTEWSISAFGDAAVSTGGIVAFDRSPVIAMVSPPSNIGIAVFDGKTAQAMGKVNLFPTATNNFDFTTGMHYYFTIESFGAPDFATSTLSAWEYHTGKKKWERNVTLNSPNLLPLDGPWSYIATQGQQGLNVYDQYSGETVAELPFTNPNFVIGNAMAGLMVIGNTVAGKVLGFRYE